MTTVQLLGRGTYGPHISVGPGVSPLWAYRHTPPAQNTVIIYNDGSVKEIAGVSNLELVTGPVRVWIYGGTDYRTTVGSWEYDALTAAGYTWREVGPQYEYPGEYGDNYQEAWGKALFDENAAALESQRAAKAAADAEYARTQRIAVLEAELAALKKGTP